MLKIVLNSTSSSFFIFFWSFYCETSVLLTYSQQLFFLNGIIIFCFSIIYVMVKIWIFFLFIALLKKFCQSTSVTVTKAEPISWFMDSPVTVYSSDFLNLTFSTSFFSVISAVNMLFSSTCYSL